MPLDLDDATVVFDLDGTLVDTAPDLATAASHALSLVGLPSVSVAELHPFIGHGSKAMIDAGLRLHEKTLPQRELDRLHAAFLDYYAANIAAHSRPYEGVIDVLRELQDAGATLAVCTNKVERLSRRLLQELDLDRRLRVIAGRDTFDVFKPAPGHLLRTITAAGGRPDRAVMVGDSEVDIATAAAASVPCIAVTFGYSTRPVRELGPSAVIGHYREFMPALERVLPPR